MDVINFKAVKFYMLNYRHFLHNLYILNYFCLYIIQFYNVILLYNLYILDTTIFNLFYQIRVIMLSRC